MSKRTTIIAIIALVAIVAAFLSLMFDYKATVAEAKQIIDEEAKQDLDEPVKAKKNQKPVKPEAEIVTLNADNNGNGTPEHTT